MISSPETLVSVPADLVSSCGGANRRAYISDEELIAHVISGAQYAQEEFVRRFGRLIYSILRRMPLTRDVMLEDVYQQVFVQLWENDCRRLRLWRNTGRFSGYLGVIVVRAAHEYRRLPAARSWRVAEEPIVLQDPGQTILQEETRQFLRHALDGLASRDREILLLRHVEELSYRDISMRMGLTINHVGVALARAEKRLEKRFRATGYCD